MNAENENPQDKYIEVGNYTKLALAEIAKASLGLEGIESEIFNGKIDSYYTTAVGGIRLMVKMGDFEKAKSVIRSVSEVEEGIVDEKDEIQDKPLVCHNCHSTSIRTRDIQYFTSHLFLANIFKKYFGYKTVFLCKNCKFTWKR
jgi:hypothetical protein